MAQGFDPSRVAPADESALATWFASHGLDLNAAAQTASQDPAYLRAQALVQHGLYRAANWEHEIFLTTYVDKPDRLYWLAVQFGSLGLPNAALKLGTAAVNAATAEGQVSVLEIPPALARAASPLAYADLVASTARARGINPLLLISLMHHALAKMTIVPSLVPIFHQQRPVVAQVRPEHLRVSPLRRSGPSRHTGAARHAPIRERGGGTLD